MVNYPLELASNVVGGLILLNGTISEEITKKLIVNAVKQLLVKGPGELMRTSPILLSSLIY